MVSSEAYILYRVQEINDRSHMTPRIICTHATGIILRFTFSYFPAPSLLPYLISKTMTLLHQHCRDLGNGFSCNKIHL